MNCFEARQDFRAFWRKELEPQRRAAMVRHLDECPQCDVAFRTFALSAPALHSDSGPSRVGEALREPARRASGLYRERAGRPARAAIGAAAAMLVVGVFAAYFSVSMPAQSLTDALSQPSPFVEVFGSDVLENGGDFAG